MTALSMADTLSASRQSKCPGKASHLEPTRPPRKCLTCARFSYAVHLTSEKWIRPAIKINQCENYIDPSAIVG